MFCPACGKPVQTGALACANCAIIFSKWKPRWADKPDFIPAVPPASVTAAERGACVSAAVILFVLRERLRGLLWILDGADLIIHEAGHPILGLFGWRFLTVAGGTIFQLAFPVAFAVHFRREGRFRSSDVCVAWIGQNLLHIGRYAADARAQELPLVGGGEHDWTYLLECFGLLPRDIQVGQAFDFAGCLLIAWAGLSLWRRSRPAAPAVSGR